jgi:hypothetical protein
MIFRHLFSYILVLFLTVVVANGCTRHAGYAQVDPLVKNYFEAFKAQDMDTVLNMYSEEFFEAFPRPMWRGKLEKLFQELGPAESYSFRNKQADSRFSGKFFIYQYDTVHGEQRAKHVLTFVQHVSEEEIKLVGHMIKAKGFEM